MLLLLENRFVFVPATAAQDWQPPPSYLQVQDIELTSADSTRLHAWWTAPRDWKPEQGALLYCHGNGGNLSHRGENLRRCRDLLSLAVLIFDYPGYGHSGGKPSEPGCYAAADAAYNWLMEVRKVPGERIVLYGVSLGAAVAVDRAVHLPHRALVMVSAFSSIPDMAQKQFPWLPARWLVRNRFNNLQKIPLCRRPIFIAHGTADRLVPFDHSERLYAAANQPKQFFAMNGFDHNVAPDNDFYLALRQFLDRNAPVGHAMDK